MISMISAFKSWLSNRQEASKKSECEIQQKVDDYLEMLRSNEAQENVNFGFDELQRVANTERKSILNCLQKEGIITSLEDSGGVINEKYSFDKITALKCWNSLKVKSKVTFLLFEDKVRNMELLDSDWVDDEVSEMKIPDDSNDVGYKTETRTVQAILQEVDDGLMTVLAGEEKLYIPLEEHPNLKWVFIEGDNLSLNCVVQNDCSSWNPTIGCFGKILSVKNFKPSREKRDVGRVTAVHTGFAIIDETVYVDYKITKQPLELLQEYEYESIETSFFADGRNFDWRLTNLIKKIENDTDRKGYENSDIAMYDTSFSIQYSENQEITKSIPVINNSSQPVKLETCEISNTCGLVRVDRKELKVELGQNRGRFNIYVKIMPKQIGSFMEELVADFGDFQKKCFVKFQIENNPALKDGRLRHSEQQNDRNVIPGRRLKDCPRFMEKRIPEYFIPRDFQMHDFKKQTALVMKDLEEYYSFLFEELNSTNYVMKMRYCLYLEERSMQIHFERYNLERAHFENKGEYLRLELKDVAEKKPSITLGDSIYAIDPFPSERKKDIMQGFIHKVEQNAVLAKFNKDFHNSHNNRDYKIEFKFSRSSYKRANYALDCVNSLSGLGNDFLFPKTKNFLRKPQLEVKLDHDENLEINGKPHEWINENLNMYQKQAIVNVLRGDTRPLPYIIYGPPGTGKTQTVVECIAQIADKIPWSRIIVAAPSNSAATLIVERLIASGKFNAGDFVRLVGHNALERNQIPAHLLKYCATVDIGLDQHGDAHNFRTEDSGVKSNCSKSIIVQYKILISTLGSFGPLMHINFPQDHFTHVIIDEAGQTVEPESLIPISFVSKSKGQVILAGDPKQLGPVIINQCAKHFGFDKSFLERLTEHPYYQPIYGPDKISFDARFVTKLKKNYRSISSVLGIYNDLFYGGQLEAQVSNENSPEIALLNTLDPILWNSETRDKNCGVFFINVCSGRNRKMADSCSWYNNEEAGHIFMFINKLKAQGVDLNDVGVITPYALQVKRLRGSLNDAMPGCEVKIGTCEEFQGQERQIILISTVRTDNNLLQSDHIFGLGFLQCPKRMNVAISRARALLVVFGKESILARDDNWRRLIQFSKDKRTYSTV